MSFEVTVSGSLLDITNNGRDVIMLTREEAFELLEKIETGLWQLPCRLKPADSSAREEAK